MTPSQPRATSGSADGQAGRLLGVDPVDQGLVGLPPEREADGLLLRPGPGRIGGVGALERSDEAAVVEVEAGQDLVVRRRTLGVRAALVRALAVAARRCRPRSPALPRRGATAGRRRPSRDTPGTRAAGSRPRRAARKQCRLVADVLQVGREVQSRHVWETRPSPPTDASAYLRRAPGSHDHACLCIVMHMELKRVAVAGASGYAGGEVLRLLLGHPGWRSAP